jgi:hypothetical protein
MYCDLAGCIEQPWWDVLRCNETSQDVLNEVLSDVLDVLNLARM